MKQLIRNYNQIGLHNILAGVSGDQEVKIIERFNFWDSEVLFEGKYVTLFNEKENKELYEEIRYMRYFGLGSEEGTLIIIAEHIY
jgi:hypothetical protein